MTRTEQLRAEIDNQRDSDDNYDVHSVCDSLELKTDWDYDQWLEHYDHVAERM